MSPLELPFDVDGDGSGGGVGAGGSPAAILRQGNNANLGLLVGLIKEDAGADWALDARARAQAVQGTANSNYNGEIITVTIPASIAVGAASNGWRVRRIKDTSATAPSVSINLSEKRINIRGNADSTFAAIQALIAAADVNLPGGTTVNIPTANIVFNGAGTATFSFTPQNGSSTEGSPGTGGRDEEPIEGEIDNDNLTVTIHYDAGDTLQEIHDALHEFELTEDEALLHVTPIHGTNMAGAAETVPFSNRPFLFFFAGAGDPRGAQFEERVKQFLKPWAYVNGPVVPASAIDDAIMRDSELTKNAIITLLGLTETELNDLLVGASISGNVLILPQNDGTELRLTLPAGTGGTTTTKHVASGQFVNNGLQLALTYTDGNTINISVPAALRNAGLSQSQVQALIDAAEADDLDTAAVNALITAALANAGQSSNRASYAGPITLRGPYIYRAHAATTYNPGQFSLGTPVNGNRAIHIRLAASDAHLADYITQFENSEITIRNASGTVVYRAHRLIFSTANGNIVITNNRLANAAITVGDVHTIELTSTIVPNTGGTFYGQVGLGLNPTLDHHAANKKYVDDSIRLALASGGDVSEHVRAGWSDDATVSAAELTATSGTNTVTLPTDTGLHYLGIWRSDADGGDPSEVHLAGGGNSRNLFGAATDLTIGSTPGKLIVSAARQNASLLGGETARLV